MRLWTLADENTAHLQNIENNARRPVDISITEDHLDAFGRIKIANPTSLFDAQFTYDLQPLVYEQIVSDTPATITHDADNRMAVLSLTDGVSGDYARLQTFEHFRYQPGKAQEITITTLMGTTEADVVKTIGYSDGTNGIEFVVTEDGPAFRILSSTDLGNETVTKFNWNYDRFDGKGPSKLTLDLTTTVIVYIDLQALYVGEVRVGFNINGKTHIAHKFLHSNISDSPYIQTANLPLRASISTTTGTTVTDSMRLICASVVSSGGQEDNLGYLFSSEGTATAGNGTDTHILSIQPKATFNSIANRSKIVLESIDVIVTGSNPVLWKACIGQALTSTSLTDVNATYSGVQTITGTLSGTPAIVFAQGYVAATNRNKQAISKPTTVKYPITLDAAGVARNLGRVTVLVQGIGGTSATRCILNWKEIR